MNYHIPNEIYRIPIDYLPSMLDVVRQYRNMRPKTNDFKSESIARDAMEWIDEYCINARKANDDFIKIPRDKLRQMMDGIDFLLYALDDDDQMEQKIRQERIDSFSNLRDYLRRLFA